ncbi:MAG: cytochrome c biogenesis protein CcsA [Gaiellales bacterium]
MAEFLVWPVLLAYGEAVFAYFGELRGPGLGGRLGTWGVRLGWLAQTTLLTAQALRAEAFPWGTWAGALNLLSWLVVTAYLIWGCKPHYRLLGLGVMPIAVGLLIGALVGGGTGVDESDPAGVTLALHVVLMLGAFAGVTVAAGMAALYLWEERRLKRRDASLLRLRLPPLEALDRLAARVSLAAFSLLTLGIAVGLASFKRGDFDLAMAVSIGLWGVYAGALIARRETGLRGRRLAWLLLAGFVVAAVLLPLTHFA